MAMEFSLNKALCWTREVEAMVKQAEIFAPAKKPSQPGRNGMPATTGDRSPGVARKATS
jgi:hypothetical protein